jgi:diaminopimelate epimerase
MEIDFLKMQACGNDFVLMDCFQQTAPAENIVSRFAKEINNRHFGVGGEGVILILPGEKHKIKIRLFQPDGSEVDYCGNAISCAARYIYDSGLAGEKKFLIETAVTDTQIEIIDSINLRINMGPPFDFSKSVVLKELSTYEYNSSIRIDEKEYTITPLSVIDAHTVLFLQDFNIPLHSLAKKIEHHAVFPAGTNVEFVRVLSREEIQLRCWERGAGESLSSAHGACAALVAAAINGFTDRDATVHLKGGNLYIQWDDKSNNLYMTGPSVYVFSGTYYFEEETD